MEKFLITFVFDFGWLLVLFISYQLIAMRPKNSIEVQSFIYSSSAFTLLLILSELIIWLLVWAQKKSGNAKGTSTQKMHPVLGVLVGLGIGVGIILLAMYL